jgi:hypothetical protein
MRLPLHVVGPVSVLALLLLAGCAGGGDGTSPARVSLPTALGARWTPPEFATRQIDGERVAVLDACVATANALGYSVSRYDGASGRVSGARRQSSAFDGARQDTLEITVTTFAPGAVTVAVVLREVIESSSSDADGRGALPPTSAIVRDRAPYDVFFERLERALNGDALPDAATVAL